VAAVFNRQASQFKEASSEKHESPAVFTTGLLQIFGGLRLETTATVQSGKS